MNNELKKIEFADERLNVIIYDKLNFKLDEPLNIYNLNSLFDLEISDVLINDYSGLEKCESLENLILYIRHKHLIKNIDIFNKITSLKKLKLVIYTDNDDNTNNIKEMFTIEECNIEYSILPYTAESFIN